MRILITNDDGINAPGLATLTAIAQDVAGPDGEVWTVAPAFEQSGVGHCISYAAPTMISKLDERTYAAQGSPADCVLAGLYDVMKDARPDLILSGVNRGNNAADNTLYSGTIGAIIEAAIQGVPGIALSGRPTRTKSSITSISHPFRLQMSKECASPHKASAKTPASV